MPASTVSAPAPTGAGVFSRPTSSRHLLGLEGMKREDLVELLEESQRFRDLLDGPGISTRGLAGVVICNAFFENSTRTRISFSLAMRRLGGDVVDFASGSSSMSKGETVIE